VPLGWADPGGAAQVEASASIDSDYQWQGLSFSDGEPAASATISGEWRNGAYAGLTGIVGPTDHDGVRPLAYIADLGYARRVGDGAAFDLGVLNSGVQLYIVPRYRFNYTQVYAGLSKGGLSAHLFYSPRYLGERVGAFYLDVDGALRPAPHWRLAAHLGAFAALEQAPEAPAERPRLDLRAGVVRELGRLEVHLFWTTTVPAPDYPTGYGAPRRAILLGATYAF
jgi:uncharacterized protein (TIGR02001 family)